MQPIASRIGRLWRDWRSLVLFIAVMLVFRSAIADWNQVPSGSMYPSIFVGDRIVVDKLAYDLKLPFTLQRIARWRAPARGDVVTFRSPEDGRLLVKRIVGVPGDTVVIRSHGLTVNGDAARYRPLPDRDIAHVPVRDPHRYRFLQETVLGHSRLVMFRREPGPADGSTAAHHVPAGHYLVLGDNRDNSRDSRAIGFVPADHIVGRATRVAFSLDYQRYYAPRLDRFFADLP